MASPWPRRDEVVPAVNNPDVADLMAEFLPEEVQRLERVFHHHEVGDPIWGLAANGPRRHRGADVSTGDRQGLDQVLQGRPAEGR